MSDFMQFLFIGVISVVCFAGIFFINKKLEENEAKAKRAPQ